MTHSREEIFSAACDAVKRMDGDYPAVIDEMVSFVLNDAALTEYMVREGLQRIVNDVTRAGRMSRSRDKSIRTARKLLENRPLTSWRLESGLKLGVAKRPDLLKAADQLERVACGFVARAIFYRRIAAKMQDDSTQVRKVLKNSEIKNEMAAAELSAKSLVGGGYE